MPNILLNTCNFSYVLIQLIYAFLSKLKSMGFLTKLFGSNKTDGINTYLKKGAILLDVRTKSEYNSVHLKNALHIPLQDIKENINKIKKLNKPVITYCQSGMRSRSAAKILRLAGINAINGGGILGLKRKLNEA